MDWRVREREINNDDKKKYDRKDSQMELMEKKEVRKIN